MILHAGVGLDRFVFKLGNKTLYIDALTNLDGRNIEPLIKPEEVEADYILVLTTIDHIDRPAWREIVKHNDRLSL